MSSHTLAYHSLHSGKTDTVLILQQFAYCTDTSVAQVVDIIIVAQTILQMHIIVNGSKDIFLGNMFWNQFIYIFLDSFCKLLRIITILIQNRFQHRIIYQLMDTQFLGIAVYIMCQINHQTGQYLNISLFCLNIYKRNSCILNLISQLYSYFGTCSCQDFACGRIHNISSQNLISDSVTKHQLLIKFISTDFGQIISTGIEEHGIDQ